MPPQCRPLYAQAHQRSSVVGKPLELALCWWQEVLALKLCQARPWIQATRKRATIMADASGWPAHIAAVVIVEDTVWYTDMRVPGSILQFFQQRNDQQILGLEMLAIALAMGTFEDELRGCDVHVYSDNTGAESGVRKGSAKEFDHTCIVHSLWTRAVELDWELTIFRVPTKANLSDLPSRADYVLMEEIGGVWRRPHLDACFWQPDAWGSLSVTARGLPSILATGALEATPCHVRAGGN